MYDPLFGSQRIFFLKFPNEVTLVNFIFLIIRAIVYKFTNPCKVAALKMRDYLA